MKTEKLNKERKNHDNQYDSPKEKSEMMGKIGVDRSEELKK